MPWPDWLDDIWTPVPKAAKPVPPKIPERDGERFQRWAAQCKRAGTLATCFGPADAYTSPGGDVFSMHGPLALYDVGTSPAEVQWEKEKHDFV